MGNCDTILPTDAILKGYHLDFRAAGGEHGNEVGVTVLILEWPDDDCEYYAQELYRWAGNHPPSMVEVWEKIRELEALDG